MDRAASIIFFIIGIGVILYFVPFLAEGLGFKVSGNIVRGPVAILYSFDGGKTIKEGEIHTGVFGGSNFDVTSFAFDPIDAEIVYAGTKGGGMLMSDDGGKNWYGLSDPKRVIAPDESIENIFVPAPYRMIIVAHKTGSRVVYETMNNMKTVHELARFKESNSASLETFLVGELELLRENVGLPAKASIAKTPERIQLALAAATQTRDDDIAIILEEMGIKAGVVAVDPRNGGHIIVGRLK